MEKITREIAHQIATAKLNARAAARAAGLKPTDRADWRPCTAFEAWYISGLQSTSGSIRKADNAQVTTWYRVKYGKRTPVTRRVFVPGNTTWTEGYYNAALPYVALQLQDLRDRVAQKGHLAVHPHSQPTDFLTEQVTYLAA